MLKTKLKSKKIGLIIWGAILIVISFMVFFYASYSNDDTVAPIANIIGLCMLPGGILMIVGGIINAVKVTQYNRRVIEEENRYYYSGVCPFCQYAITCELSAFSPHRRFPEGFIYCPVCKKPVSKRVFQQLLKSNNAPAN
ncbi:MAG: hypothetical protein IJR88_04715 [Clostridia bacterium]|nr:hypothetical protein [Clostridia bacterium]